MANGLANIADHVAQEGSHLVQALVGDGARWRACVADAQNAAGDRSLQGRDIGFCPQGCCHTLSEIMKAGACQRLG